MLRGRGTEIQKGFSFSSQRVLVFMLQEIFSWELLTHHLLRSPLCWKPYLLFWPSFGKKLGIWRILTGAWSTSLFRSLEQEGHKFKARLCKWMKENRTVVMARWTMLPSRQKILGSIPETCPWQIGISFLFMFWDRVSSLCCPDWPGTCVSSPSLSLNREPPGPASLV